MNSSTQTDLLADAKTTNIYNSEALILTFELVLTLVLNNTKKGLPKSITYLTWNTRKVHVIHRKRYIPSR